MSAARETPDDALRRRLERATRRGGSKPADDPELSALAEGWRVLGQALDQSTPKSAPPAFAHRILHETLRRAALRRRWQWGLGLFAAAVLAVGLGAYLFRPGEPAQVAGNLTPEKIRPAEAPKDEESIATTPQDWQPRYPKTELPPESTAAIPDPWEELDQEISDARTGIDDLQGQWQVSTSYLDYIAEQFREMEEELALTSL